MDVADVAAPGDTRARGVVASEGAMPKICRDYREAEPFDAQMAIGARASFRR
jgi:hypothetical protein